MKYLIIDNATGEETKVTHEEFMESLKYNMEVAVNFGDKVTWKDCYWDFVKFHETTVNGFTFRKEQE